MLKIEKKNYSNFKINIYLYIYSEENFVKNGN